MEKLRRSYDSTNLHTLPLFGAGCRPDMYRDMMLRELGAQLEEDDMSLTSDILDDMNDSTRVTTAIQVRIGGIRAKWTCEVEAMLRIYQEAPWNELLLRWQLELVRDIRKFDTLSLGDIKTVQKDVGSGVWPAGDNIPDLLASKLLWRELEFPEGHPGLLVSGAWPSGPEQAVIFGMDNPAATLRWFPPLIMA